MKIGIHVLVFTTALAIFSPVHADSFRTEEGKIVSAGLSRAKVLALMGKPDSQHTESVGINVNTQDPSKNPQGDGQTTERWIYTINNSFSQRKIVTLIIKDGIVQSVDIEDPDR